MKPLNGPLRSFQLGSVRKVTPSSCTSTVEWPIQVTVAAREPPRRVAQSGVPAGRAATRRSVKSHVPPITNECSRAQ